MLKNTSISPQSILRPGELTGLHIPAGARAVLVVELSNGGHKVSPIQHGESVLDIEQDLLSHLNASPLSDEFLSTLRDYCDARLAARAEARDSGGLVMCQPVGFHIAHVQAFQPVSVSGGAA
ncbi:hypothetical protein WAE61_09025 [Comamonadaceae bacterium PP-2]